MGPAQPLKPEAPPPRPVPPACLSQALNPSCLPSLIEAGRLLLCALPDCAPAGLDCPRAQNSTRQAHRGLSGAWCQTQWGSRLRLAPGPKQTSRGEKSKGPEAGDRGGPALSLNSGRWPGRVLGRAGKAGPWLGVSRLQLAVVLSVEAAGLLAEATQEEVPSVGCCSACWGMGQGAHSCSTTSLGAWPALMCRLERACWSSWAETRGEATVGPQGWPGSGEGPIHGLLGPAHCDCALCLARPSCTNEDQSLLGARTAEAGRSGEASARSRPGASAPACNTSLPGSVGGPGLSKLVRRWPLPALPPSCSHSLDGARAPGAPAFLPPRRARPHIPRRQHPFQRAGCVSALPSLLCLHLALRGPALTLSTFLRRNLGLCGVGEVPKVTQL